MRNSIFSYFNLKTYFHKHILKPYGWSYIKCAQCEVTYTNPAKNSELQVPIIQHLYRMQRRTK